MRFDWTCNLRQMKELGLTVDVQAEVYTIAGMIEAILNMEK